MGDVARKYEVGFDWTQTGTFVDESASLVGVTARLGRSEELGAVEPARCTIILENEDGRFTPEYTAGPLYGLLELERAARWVGYLSDGTTPAPLFYGYITDIDVDIRSHRVIIELQDYSLFLAAYDLSLGPLEGYTTGAIIEAILDEAGFTGAREIDAGQTVIPYWFARNTNAWDAIQTVVEHELGGLFYFRPGLIGETAVFEDRHARANQSPGNTWDNVIGNLAYQRRSSQVYARAKIALGGYEEGIPGSVIYAHAPLPVALAAGETLALEISYSQPARNVIAPVAGTDYVANASADGTGADRTSSVTVSFQNYGGGASYHLTNGHSGTVHFQVLQIRGTPLGLPTDQRVVQRTGTALGALAKTFEHTYPLLDDRVLAGSFADYIVQHYARPQPLLRVEIPADSEGVKDVLFALRISGRERISDDAFPWSSNVDQDWFIESLEHECRMVPDGAGVHLTRLTLTSFLADQFWLLGVAGASELGESTILGY